MPVNEGAEEMKKIVVREEWCLGCHLCEYFCDFANSGLADMVKALQDKTIHPRITVEGDNQISFAVNCRHCDRPLCVAGCIAGALYKEPDGVVRIDQEKCVGCGTCVLSCPYGAIMPNGHGVAQKCELCMDNVFGTPQCVQHCPNRAIVIEEVDAACAM